MSATTLTPSRPLTCAPSRAARELGLKRGEFDLAVHLGRIRTVPDDGGGGDGGGRRVPRTEIDRLQARAETHRASVPVGGPTAGAAPLWIAPGL
ncbi:DUF6397 family protein, partial [Streptomyces sp. NPDC059627]